MCIVRVSNIALAANTLHEAVTVLYKCNLLVCLTPARTSRGESPLLFADYAFSAVPIITAILYCYNKRLAKTVAHLVERITSCELFHWGKKEKA